MSEPYWSDGQVSLYLGDCREVTEWLAADVLCTDPPYGINSQPGEGGLAGPRRPGDADRRSQPRRLPIAGDLNTDIRDAAVALWGDRPGVVFGDLDVTPPAGYCQRLIYRKPPDAGTRGTRGGFRHDIEGIYLTGPWPPGLGGRSSVIETGARKAGSEYGLGGRHGHPHAKPVDVMETLIAACPPGTIADPCAGSCSTLIAARNQGRPAIGVEINERSCEMAARRLSQADLFTATQ